MRSQSVSRGASPIATITLFVLIILVLAGLSIGSLWALEIGPFAKKAGAQRPEGIEVPLSSRPIPAYTKLTREHFLHPRTGHLVVSYISEKEAKDSKVITDLGQLLGRVLKRDKAAGYAFREEDLEPEGTRPGFVAGIPAGKRSFVLNGDKVHGIHNLKAGDHFDLLGSLALDSKAPGKYTAIGADPVSIQGNTKQAKVRVLVQNGVIVVPAATREIPTGPPSQAKGGKAPTKTVQEVTIAIDPNEVADLHEALTVQATLMCVARSGQPDEAKMKSVTSGSAPPLPIHAMEVIHGSKRQTLIFPTPGKGPEEAPSLTSDTDSESSKK